MIYKEIKVTDEKERNKLEIEIAMCLQILYKLEDITRYDEEIISKCVDFLQQIKVVNINESRGVTKCKRK